MTISNDDLRFSYLPCLNYAMAVNGRRCIETCELTNNSDEEWSHIEVRIEGELLAPSNARVDLLPAGATVSLDTLDIKPDIDRLREMTESITTQFALRILNGEETLWEQTYEIRLLAFDEWSGVNVMPEMTAAFVMPNASELSRVNMSAARYLKKFTGDSSLDEYQSLDPNRVRAQVAAVYEALREEGFVYCAVPASFEERGQRIRLGEQVLREKLGNCADLSLLYASCLESIGLRPMLVVYKGHMFLGCWLIPRFYPHTICDDVSLLSKSIANGINELVLVESTQLTSPNVSFDEAVRSAEDRIRNHPDDFVLAIDLFSCRTKGIRPLPVKVNGVWQQDGIQLDHSTRKVGEQVRYDLPQEERRTATKQDIWERKLLDFSLRNNLLNLRIGQRCIPFISYHIDQLENRLQAKEDYLIQPCPINERIKPESDGMYQSNQYRDQLEKIAMESLKHNRLCSYLHDTDLANVLKKLFRESRTALEENGANTLFLVIGLLRWYENERSTKPRYAPLLLLPVSIVKKSGNNYVLRIREEESTFNTTLSEMLRQQHEINLPGLSPLPEDESGIDVLKVFSIVRSALKDHPRWDIVEESLLSLFSFSKFVMWNDIHNNAEKMRRNPIIESLIQKKLVGHEEQTNTDTRQLDQLIEPAKMAIPVDVDSSQLEAVIESGEGRSFILYGPPGTGKSQTITNMIANALFHDRRVLFVAEKMAALEVVQKRLARIGLDPFCLEMHSNKMTKSHLLEQLQKALDTTRLKPSEEFAAESKRLFEQRCQLIKHVERLHTMRATGYSLYDLIVRYLAIGNSEELPLKTAFYEGINAERLEQAESALRQLSTIFAITGPPSSHPLRGLEVMDPSNTAQLRIRELIDRIYPLLGEASRQTAAFASQNGFRIQADLTGAQWTDKMVTLCSHTPEVNIHLLRLSQDSATSKKWKDFIDIGKQRDQLSSRLLSENTPDILQLPEPQVRSEWNEACSKWFLPRYFAKRSIVKRLKQLNKSVRSSNVEALLDQVALYQKAANYIESGRQQMETIFGRLAAKGQEQWQQMTASIDLAGTIFEHLRTTGVTVASLPPFSKEQVTGADIGTVRMLLGLLGEYTQVAGLEDDLPLSEAQTRCATWKQHLDQARDWAQWTIRKPQLRAAHLQPAIDYIEEGHNCDEAADAMLRTAYKTMALQVIDSDPDLQMFNGLLFEKAIDEYRALARKFQDITKKALYCKLASRVPSLTIEASNSSEIGILKRYIASGGRGATIRHIIDQIPTLLPKLCPCMLMSPLSVAQFIDLDQDKFDIVVFDEASQMPTSEAIGAIARGNALIVVGDPKQMPPTSFFATNQVDESEADVDDMESILDDCITLSMPDHYLRWHYRSRHESLIAFSNSQYYDGKLYTFPSVDDRQSKVSFIPITGAYDMGRTRSNRAEADAIVKETLRRLDDAALSARSIGIVSFSKAQQDLIEDLLVDALSKRPDLEAKAYDVAEPIFVKNLENVQGDERDVILFSVGYGPDKSGRVSMNFGPLNNQGGERRLNVAVSRARYEMMVFSTLQPEQIDLNRSRARGVEGLKRFLEFAKNGRMPIEAGQFAKQQDTSLVDDIAREIEALGYKTDKHVGRSNFTIDLAVVDPADSGRYLMGILCDGTNYYATSTERDREICQPSVLEGLGWNLMRVWSVDWLLNSKRVIDRIKDRLQELTTKKEEPTVPETPAAPVEQIAAKSQQPAAAAPLADMPFTVDANEILPEDAGNDLLEDYEEAHLRQRQIRGGVQTMAKMMPKVVLDVMNIIKTEQPVCRSIIMRRLKDVYQLTRVSADLAALVDRAAGDAYRDPLSDAENPFYWANPSAAAGYKGYRKSNNRDMTEIPLIEIMNVVKMAVDQQFSLPTEDLLRQVARIFGFSRRTAKSDEVVLRAIKVLSETRQLNTNGDMVSRSEK